MGWVTSMAGLAAAAITFTWRLKKLKPIQNQKLLSIKASPTLEYGHLGLSLVHLARSWTFNK